MPAEFLNEKFHPEPPIDIARLGRLRREKRIHGEKVGARVSIYSHKALEMVTVADIQDKRRAKQNGDANSIEAA